MLQEVGLWDCDWEWKCIEKKIREKIHVPFHGLCATLYS